MNKVTVGALGLALVVLTQGASIMAAELPSHTVDNPPPYPSFNALADSKYGNEAEFLGMVDKDGQFWRGDVCPVIEMGDECTFYVFYHNSGVSDGIPTRAYAHDACVKVGLSGEAGDVVMTATIKASNTTPREVSCNLPMTVTDGARLSYVDGSAKMVNNDKTDGQFLIRDELFSEEGAVIGTNSLTGIVLNGYEHAGYIEFKMQAVDQETAQATAKPTARPTVAELPTEDVHMATETERRPDLQSEESDWALLATIVIAVLILVIAIVVFVVFLVKEVKNSELDDDEDDSDDV